jgi:NTE family protein
MLVGHDQAQLAKPWIAARALEVDTKQVGIVDFGLSQDDQHALFQSGRKAGQAFMRTWDWDDYLARFRLPSPLKKAA